MQKSKKNLKTLDEYISIGFDVDHCLIRYNLGEFFSTTYKLIAQTLVNNYNYPSEMLEFTKREKCFIMNGLIVDCKNGFIIKLGENKVILRAYYGYDRVPQEELEKIYGSPPKFDIFDPYNCRAEDYYCCISFFECFLPPLLAHMIAYKKKIHDHPEKIDPRKVIKDLVSASMSSLGSESYNEELGKNLQNILYKQEKMKEILKSLRNKGKTLFLVSNGSAAYLSMVMKYAYGEDWATLFDFIVPSSGKPDFFYSQGRPFYAVDEKLATIENQVVEKLERHNLHVGGNAKILEENIKGMNGEKTGRVLFFGDNYSTDALAAEKIEHWDAVCIMEELEGVDFGEGYDDSYWGHWEYEETAQGKVATFWYSYMKDNVAKCVSFVYSDEMVSFFEEKKEK